MFSLEDTLDNTVMFKLAEDYKDHKAGDVINIPRFMSYFPWNYNLVGCVVTEETTEETAKVVPVKEEAKASEQTKTKQPKNQ